MKTIDLLNLTDAELGAHCRKFAIYLDEKKISGYEAISIMSSAFLLCSNMQLARLGSMELKLDDVTSEMFPKPVNFKITIEKTS